MADDQDLNTTAWYKACSDWLLKCHWIMAKALDKHPNFQLSADKEWDDYLKALYEAQIASEKFIPPENASKFEENLATRDHKWKYPYELLGELIVQILYGMFVGGRK